MALCKQCNKQFKTNITRKYCYECKPKKKFGKDLVDNTEKIIICKECKKEYNYSRQKGHTLTICGSCMASRQKSYKKQYLIDYKGSKCQVCNYNKCINTLDFHHINPEEKSFTISGNHGKSLYNLKKEVDKCILLCRNCHAEYHSGLINLDKKNFEIEEHGSTG